ncbi:MAG: tRNA (adenosine(37)-N6)-threonylcarbamoyltransferase complex dimerization subunit type 1 TsaB, partial [Saprospiraceae bacterium]
MAPDTAFIILIDTATDICSVAISANDKVLDFQVDKSGERRHASLLPGMIETTLQKVSLSLQDISAVAYSKGPGSYTG